MSGLKGGVASLALAAAVGAAQGEEPREVSVGTEANTVATQTQIATTRLMVDVGLPVLVAQATPPESDGKEYFADVLQIDGKTKVRVTYFRDKQGAIIPPAIVGGKLVDGSPAPNHPLRALNAQVKILVPYDKAAQVALAMVGDKDLMKEAGLYIASFGEKIESGKPITRNEFETYLFHTYIYIEAGSKGDGFMKLADNVAAIKLKLTPVEYTTMKSDAQVKAKKIWKSTTGAVA